MEEQILNDNQNVAVADNQTGPADNDASTVQPGGQANGQTPAEETLGGIDPNQLPPVLRAKYDDMLRDYRTKTASVSERVKSETQKAVEAYKQKAQWYDEALKDENLVKTINEYVTKASQTKDPSKIQLPPEIQEKLNKVDEIEKEIKTTKALETINAFAEAKNEKGEPLHPNFDKYHSVKIGDHPSSGEYSLLRAAIELAPGKTEQEKMDNGYKAVEAIWNKALEEGKKAGMGRVQEKARNSSFSPSSVNAGSTAPRQPKNAMEALQFARQGLTPNRG